MSVDVKYREEEDCVQSSGAVNRELCDQGVVNREVGLGSHSPSQSSPVLISHTVSADVKHHERRRLCAELRRCVNSEVGLTHSSPVPNKPYDVCGRKAP